jgi:hypothetical protein
LGHVGALDELGVQGLDGHRDFVQYGLRHAVRCRWHFGGNWL